MSNFSLPTSTYLVSNRGPCHNPDGISNHNCTIFSFWIIRPTHRLFHEASKIFPRIIHRSNIVLYLSTALLWRQEIIWWRLWFTAPWTNFHIYPIHLPWPGVIHHPIVKQTIDFITGNVGPEYDLVITSISQLTYLSNIKPKRILPFKVFRMIDDIGIY